MTRWRIIPWVFITIYGLLAYEVDYVAASALLFLLLSPLLLSLGIGCWLASWLFQLLTKRQMGRGVVFVRWSLVSLAFAVAGLLGGCLYNPPPVPLQPINISDELRYILMTDQSDRFRLLRIFVMEERDRHRLERTKALNDSGEIVQPQDKFHAAWIFHHGLDTTNYETAYRLASEAADAGVVGADWLKNAAYDRWMISQGKPQEHGTQFHFQFQFPGTDP